MLRISGSFLLVQGHAFSLDAIGVACAFNFLPYSSFSHGVSKWRTLLTAYSGQEKVVLDGNHLPELKETLQQSNTGIVRLSPNLYLYTRLPMGVASTQTRGRFLRIEVAGQSPVLDVRFGSRWLAQEALREIRNSSLELL